MNCDSYIQMSLYTRVAISSFWYVIWVSYDHI